MLGEHVSLFLYHRKVRPMIQKRSALDRTAAKRNHVAEATRRRRRIALWLNRYLSV